MSRLRNLLLAAFSFAAVSAGAASAQV
ncbi:CREA protein, partial [Rhizobium sp. PEPV16]